MESLFSRAIQLELRDITLSSGRTVALRHLTVRFGRASPDRLKEGALPRNYTEKPLVTFNGDAMFGELAVLRWLEADGWSGVWLDTLHGRKMWREMPTQAAPVALPSAPQSLYDRIIAENDGRASGTFDVMAWRGAQTIFVDYEAPGEIPSRNRNRWIDAALDAGISPNDLLIVSAE